MHFIYDCEQTVLSLCCIIHKKKSDAVVATGLDDNFSNRSVHQNNIQLSKGISFNSYQNYIKIKRGYSIHL